MPYASVLDLEEAWFLDSSLGLPPLAAADGGPFGVVAAHVRRLSQHPRQLFIGHGPTTDLRRSKAGDRLVRHEIVVLVAWPSVGAGHRAHEDQARLDDAVDAVLARVRGPVDDIGHGGRWWGVADARVEPPNPATILAFRDAIGAMGGGYEVAIRYSVLEMA